MAFGDPEAPVTRRRQPMLPDKLLSLFAKERKIDDVPLKQGTCAKDSSWSGLHLRAFA